MQNWLLIETRKAIDAMQISARNQDVHGDPYEYLFVKLNTAGQSSQFRTPRHITRTMVNMCEPHPGEPICDPAAGTSGFLVKSWQHLLETHTDPRDISYDGERTPHGLTGSRLTKEEWGGQPDHGPHRLRFPRRSPKSGPTTWFSPIRHSVGAIDPMDVDRTLPAKCRRLRSSS